MGVPDSYTKVLMHFNEDAYHYDTVDASGKQWSSYNSAGLDHTYYKFGGGSLKLSSATSDYITTVDHDDFTLTTGSFTIDMWVRHTTLPGSGLIMTYMMQGAAGNYWSFYMYNSSGSFRLTWGAYVGGSPVINLYETVTPSTATWYHCAVSRSGDSTYYLFFDGNTSGSQSDTSSISNWATNAYVGAFTGSSSFFNGYMDEIRFSKGIARWTANFTPPSREYGAYGNVASSPYFIFS